MEKNRKTLKARLEEAASPMTHHTALHVIQQTIPRDSVIVNEGANTLDIARSILDMREPRLRLDSGTLATMGVGMGYAIAAQLHHPDRPVVAVVGDSAFGFRLVEGGRGCMHG